MSAAASAAPLPHPQPWPAGRPARRLQAVPPLASPQAPAPARARPLPRSGPRLDWDPLTVDAEYAGPEFVEVPELAYPQPAPSYDATRLAGAVACAVAEVLAGTRPAPQVQRWLHEDVWQVVRRRAALSRRSPTGLSRPHGMRVIKVHPCQVSPTALEASVILHDGERVRAAAIRLHLRRGQWRAAALRIG